MPSVRAYSRLERTIEATEIRHVDGTPAAPRVALLGGETKTFRRRGLATRGQRNSLPRPPRRANGSAPLYGRLLSRRRSGLFPDASEGGDDGAQRNTTNLD